MVRAVPCAVSIAFGIAALAVIMLAQGCRAPTEVTLTVRTTTACAELRDVQITVGPSPRATEDKVSAKFVTTSTRNCGAAGLVGTLVITPGGAEAAAIVVGGFGADAASCHPPDYAGCVVARRSFAFVDHVALDIPIDLDSACRDVPCDAVTTCKRGLCVSARVDCSSAGTCSDIGGAPNGGSDAGRDATIIADARTEDAAPDSQATDATMDDATPNDSGPDSPPDASTLNTCTAADVDPMMPNPCIRGGIITMCLGGQFCCHGAASTTCVNNGDDCPGFAQCCAYPCQNMSGCCVTADVVTKRGHSKCGMCSGSSQFCGPSGTPPPPPSCAGCMPLPDWDQTGKCR